MPPPPPPPDDTDDVVANNSSTLFSDEDMAWYRSVEKNAEMHSMNVQEIQKLSDMMRVLGAQTK
jgi:superfamily II DNA helicase RecQ